MSDTVDRTRHCDTTKEKDRVVEDYLARGFEVEKNTRRTARLKKKGGWGSKGIHVLLALLTGWFTFGLVNIAYGWWHRKKNTERVLVQAQQTGTPSQEKPEPKFDTRAGAEA